VGCIAPIGEERSYGAAWPAADARTETTEERRDAGPTVRATVDGKSLDVAVERITECRKATVTDRMLHEVVIRRSFADPAPQAWDAAATLLLLTGAGLAALDADMLSCPRGPAGCRDESSSASAPVILAAVGLSLIPLAFATYNWIRVQDDWRIEPAPAATEAGAWSPCETRPMSDEEVALVIGDREVRVAKTGADGHAVMEWPPLAATGGETAVVKHKGTPDVLIIGGGAARSAAP
jgi:hypothetical protein